MPRWEIRTAVYPVLDKSPWQLWGRRRFDGFDEQTDSDMHIYIYTYI